MTKKLEKEEVKMENEVTTTEVVEVKKEMTESEKKLAYLAKKQALRKLLRSRKFVVDGYNENQKYEYIKSYQYKDALDEACIEVGLDYTITGVNCIFENMVKSDKMYLSTLISDLTLVDIDTGYEGTAVRIFTTGSDNLDKGIYKASSMIIKTYLQTEFGITGKNDVDCEEESAPKTSNFITPAKKDELVKNIVANSTPAPQPQGELTTPEFLNKMKEAILTIREKGDNKTFADSTLKDIENALTTNVMLSQATMTRKMLKIEESLSALGV